MKAEVKILLSDPKTKTKPRYRTYTVPFTKGDKVLGALLYLHKNLDPCLSFRFNCRSRHCGECSMMINGKPLLSCEAPMVSEVTLEPLRNLTLIKDLVIDRNGVYREILKHLPRIQEGSGHGNGLGQVPTQVIERIIGLDSCIHCLSCMAVCPVYKKEPKVFPGPFGLLALATSMERQPGVDCGKAALCTDCGRCEKVCPRHIPILTKAIEALKKRGRCG